MKPPHDKTNKVTVRSAKTQISLGIRPVGSESSLCTQWVAKDPSFLQADREDQPGRMPRLICVFAGRTVTLLVLSYRGSYFLIRTVSHYEDLLTLIFTVDICRHYNLVCRDIRETIIFMSLCFSFGCTR